MLIVLEKSQYDGMMFFYGSVVKRLEIILFVSVFSGRLSIFDAVSNRQKRTRYMRNIHKSLKIL